MFREIRRRRQALARENYGDVFYIGGLHVCRPWPALKYAPNDSTENRRRAIDRKWKPLCMLEMSIDRLSGK